MMGDLLCQGELGIRVAMTNSRVLSPLVKFQRLLDKWLIKQIVLSSCFASKLVDRIQGAGGVVGHQ